jgi:hypothetical protein
MEGPCVLIPAEHLAADPADLRRSFEKYVAQTLLSVLFLLLKIPFEAGPP